MTARLDFSTLSCYFVSLGRPSRFCWHCNLVSIGTWPALADTLHFYRSMARSKTVLLDTLVSNLADDYDSVSESAKTLLAECCQSVDGVADVLKERVYEVSTQLPRLLRTTGEHAIYKYMGTRNEWIFNNHCPMANPFAETALREPDSYV